MFKSFPHNPTISFPQTIDLSETAKGKAALGRMKKIYSKHPRLLLCAREKFSFRTMQKHFPDTRTVMVPDIVMCLDPQLPETARVGITLCLRKDKERLLSESDQMRLRKGLSAISDSISDHDTHIGRGNISHEDRERELEKIWRQFGGSQWVITDRLHGMIFGFITKTPTIALRNNNRKLEGCFEWIRESGYVYMMENFDIERIVETIKNHDMDVEEMKNSFAVLSERINLATDKILQSV